MTRSATVPLVKDKEKILRLRRQSSMEHDQILLFPNYTAVMGQRQSFQEVLQLLRENEIWYSLRFPGRLHIHYQIQVKVFNHPDGTKVFVNRKL
ncbi:hypothetical protein GOODEAATRI_021929 [Goodea atripinnis]|uniref:Uncharacterized protein n=1 Tax=Goodea atripinnis TaxID=208336 RepID=A0ABV0N4T6_9TELE